MDDMLMNTGTTRTPYTPYDPARLLDALLHHFQLDNDGALSRRLNVASQVLYAIRQGERPIPASMLLWMQEASGLSMRELRQLLGDRRATLRPTYAIRPPQRKR